MLEEGGYDGASHGSENEEDRKSEVVLQERGEVVVVEDDEEEGSGSDKGDEGGRVEYRAEELVRGGVGGGLDVDQGRSGDGRRGGRGGGGGGEGGEDEHH